MGYFLEISDCPIQVTIKKYDFTSDQGLYIYLVTGRVGMIQKPVPVLKCIEKQT